jgi:hypothetical protein
MSQPLPAPFLRDPITVPRKELIEHYRALAARYRQLAERQQRSSVHEGLVGLARQCAAMADALAGAKTDQSAKPELSKAEILLLLNQVIAEEKSASAGGSEERLPHSPAAAPVLRELSLDEILQKVQRDIAEGRPAAG